MPRSPLVSSAVHLSSAPAGPCTLAIDLDCSNTLTATRRSPSLNPNHRRLEFSTVAGRLTTGRITYALHRSFSGVGVGSIAFGIVSIDTAPSEPGERVVIRSLCSCSRTDRLCDATMQPHAEKLLSVEVNARKPRACLRMTLPQFGSLDTAAKGDVDGFEQGKTIYFASAGRLTNSPV